MSSIKGCLGATEKHALFCPQDLREFTFFEDTIHEFKVLLENKKEGCNIRRDWKKSNMNGKNLVLMCENKANWALQSVGITDMGIQIKIMKSIQNKM